MYIKVKLILFLFLCISTVSLQAQPKPPSKEDMLKQLVKQLDLTDKQKEKVSSILDVVQKKLNAFKPGSGSYERPPMDKINEVFKYQDQEIEKVLTTEQKKKYAEVIKERENRKPPPGKRSSEQPGDFQK